MFMYMLMLMYIYNKIWYKTQQQGFLPKKWGTKLYSNGIILSLLIWAQKILCL